jgi:hypothetical protein
LFPDAGPLVEPSLWVRCIVHQGDEMDPAQGRGWAVLKGDELHGRIFFHQGDDYGCVAKRAEDKAHKARK